MESGEGGNRAKLDLQERLQGCLVAERPSRAVIQTEEAGCRNAVDRWDRAGVKEGYRRREIKMAERGAWRKLMDS